LDKKVVSSLFKEKESEWNNEYSRIKNYFKGYLVGTEHDYKIFFNNLGL